MGSGWERGTDAPTRMPRGDGVGGKGGVGGNLGIGKFEVRGKWDMCSNMGIEFGLSRGLITTKWFIACPDRREGTS